MALKRSGLAGILCEKRRWGQTDRRRARRPSGGSLSCAGYFLQGAGGIRAGQQSREKGGGGGELHGTRVSELPPRRFRIIASQNPKHQHIPQTGAEAALPLALFAVYVETRQRRRR